MSRKSRFYQDGFKECAPGEFESFVVAASLSRKDDKWSQVQIHVPVRIVEKLGIGKERKKVLVAIKVATTEEIEEYKRDVGFID